jgi:hypothetical protein
MYFIACLQEAAWKIPALFRDGKQQVKYCQVLMRLQYVMLDISTLALRFTVQCQTLVIGCNYFRPLIIFHVAVVVFILQVVKLGNQ